MHYVGIHEEILRIKYENIQPENLISYRDSNLY
jgi:hypothetical protein